MPRVYDKPDQDQENDLFNNILSPNEEAAMEQRARDGAAEDILHRGETSDEGIANFYRQQGEISDNEKPSLDSFYKDGSKGTGLLDEDRELRGPGQKIRGALRKKRNKLVIAATGSIISGVLGFLSFLPLQFTHLAELLTQFNFSVTDESADARTSRLIRYLKYPNQPEMRRLGWFGNNVADRVQNRLTRAGTTLNYNQSGFLTSIDIDSNNRKLVRDAQKRGLTVDIDADSGRARIPLSDVNNSGRRGALRLASRNAGYAGGKLAAAGTRQLSIRSGVGFKVFGNFERGTRETFRERVNNWRENRAARRNGNAAINTVAANLDSDEDGNAVPTDDDGNPVNSEERQRVAGDLDETSNTRREIAVEADPKTKLSLSRRALIGGLAGIGAVTVYCELLNLGDQADNIRWAQTALKYQRIGMDILVGSSQILLGQLTAEEAGLLVSEIQEVATIVTEVDLEGNVVSEEELGNAFDSNLIQKSMGNDRGSPLPDSYNPEPTAALSFIQSLPGIPDPICPVLSSVWTGAILTVASLGSLTVANAFISAALVGAAAFFLDDIARLLAGSGIEDSPVGSNYGGAGFIGTHLARNELEISSGGHELSPQEIVQNNAWRDKIIAEENSEKSTYERFLSPDNPRSVAMTAALSMPTTWRSSIASIFTAPFENIGKLFKPVSAQSIVTAEDIFNYPTYGLTQEEINAYDNPDERYSIAPEIDRLNQEYSGACFGVEFDEGPGDAGTLRILESVDYETLEDQCELDREDDDVELKYRLYIGDMMALTTLGCYEGVETFCTEIGYGASTYTSANRAGAETPQPGLVYVLGDSISNGARSEYERQFDTGSWSVFIDAVDSRQLAGDATLSEIRSNTNSLNALTEATAVVIELGANNLTGAGFEDLVRETLSGLREINPNATYYWVDIGSNPTAFGNTDENTPAVYSSNNTDIYSLAPANELNYTVIPWFKEVFGQDLNPTQITAEIEPESNYLSDDDLHPNTAGMRALAALVSTVVRGESVSQITTTALIGYKYD